MWVDVTQYRRPASIAAVLVVALLAAAAVAQPPAARGEGVLRVLTYNVAGLPEGISRSRPSVNIPLIGPLLEPYDLVLVQEDFAFQAQLRAGVRHPHASVGSGTGELHDLGDGLNRFSRAPFRDHRRVRWARCNGVFEDGSDCLAPKGYSVASHELAPGVVVDVYNLHMDAGRSPADRRVRAAQVAQLLDDISRRSADRAVVVAGDTNLWERDEEVLRRWLRDGRLRDCCRALACRDARRIDRVMVRDGGRVALEPLSWRVDPRFVDAAGRPLSDHRPVAVRLRWRVIED